MTSPIRRVSVDESQPLLGVSSRMVQLTADLNLASRSDSKVLITGETGAGKEVVARLIHEKSARRHHPFITLNCAAVPDTLLESELFGHTRGSFTGAYQDKAGVAALADRGTLFLDEVGEMSPRMQAVLLRFTETREVHPIGSDRKRRIDTRIIAATNRDLSSCIASGQFRQDLFYRLNVIQIIVPPLRERGADISVLFMHFLDQYARGHGIATPAVAPEVHMLLQAHSWPGNVRELKNTAERIVVRHVQGVVSPADLPREVRCVANSALRPVAAMSEKPSEQARSTAEHAWRRMIVEGTSFWVAVHPLFIEREITKNDLRHIIRCGLEQTQGSYRKLVELFNLSASDYKRFLAFLYQHDCHLAFHPFREAQAGDRASLPTRATA